jgi:hypothetical protein
MFRLGQLLVGQLSAQGKVDEAEQDVSAALVADLQAPVAHQPRQ